MKQVTAVGPVTERRRKPSGSFVRPMGVMPTDTSEGHAASGDPWDAYFGASLLVETPDGAVWVYPAPVGVGEGNYLDPNGSVICVITAHNQGGRAASDQENAAAQQRLEDELAQRGGRQQAVMSRGRMPGRVPPSLVPRSLRLPRWALTSVRTRSSCSIRGGAGSSAA